MSDEMKTITEQEAETVSGGKGLDKVICCTCGKEIRLNGPVLTEYYNNNICPYCKGRLKTW